MNFPDPKLPAILIVDDCEDDIFLLRHRLRAGDIANPVVTFQSPADALNYLRCRAGEHAPAVLFTDIKLPGESGFDLIARVRNDPRWDDMRVVVITSSNEPADLERALELRADGYLIKFPSPEVLATFVTRGPWFAVPRQATALTHALSA